MRANVIGVCTPHTLVQATSVILHNALGLSGRAGRVYKERERFRRDRQPEVIGEDSGVGGFEFH